MSGVRGVVAVGALLGLAVAAAGLAARGGGAALAGALGGAVALVAQAGAVALLRPVMRARTDAFVGRWAMGMAVRGMGAVVLVVLVVLLRERLPALWLAAGFLVVLLPLLFTETRFLR